MKRVRLLYVATKRGPDLAEVVMRLRGLAVTRLVEENPEEPIWSITHLATGQAVAVRLAEAAARRLARRLARLPIDWKSLTYDEAVRLGRGEAPNEPLVRQIARARKESAA